MLIEEGYEVPDIIQDQMGLSDAHNVSRSAVVANLLSRSVCSMLSGICLLVSHVFFGRKLFSSVVALNYAKHGAKHVYVVCCFVKYCQNLLCDAVAFNFLLIKEF